MTITKFELDQHFKPTKNSSVDKTETATISFESASNVRND